MSFEFDACPATSTSFRVQGRSSTAAAVGIPSSGVNSVATTAAVAAPVAPAIMADSRRIRAALEIALALPPPAVGSLRVCEVTEDEWNAFVDSEERLTYLQWFVGAREIHIIEFAHTPHGAYVAEFSQLTSFAERNIHRWLKPYSDAMNSQGRRWLPDLSYGPRDTTPGSVLPPGVPINDDFRTIKVEVGVTQPWGMAEGELDHKAMMVWAPMPGVEYVLCVKFDPDYSNAEFKLYDARGNPLVQLAPRPIVAPETEVHFDGRRILGIPPGGALPVGFPATLTVDLYGPLEWAGR